jgi:hypothetical protein
MGLRDDARHSDRVDRFVSVYSGTSVMSVLYRNEPERFYQARDSIFEEHRFNADSMEVLQEELEGEEENWSRVWSRIRHVTDSLIEYYRANPVEHPPDSAADSVSTSN